MLRCNRCKQYLPEENFGKNKSNPTGKSSRCLTCSREYGKLNAKRNHERVIANSALWRKKYRFQNRIHYLEYLKAHPCVDCGITDTRVLEFDHIRDKKYDISTMFGKGTWSLMLKEIAKCEVVCCNCHRIRTFSRLPTCYRNEDGPVELKSRLNNTLNDMATASPPPVLNEKAVCELRKSGLQVKDIAEKFNVHRTTVSRLLRRFGLSKINQPAATRAGRKARELEKTFGTTTMVP